MAEQVIEQLLGLIEASNKKSEENAEAIAAVAADIGEIKTMIVELKESVRAETANASDIATMCDKYKVEVNKAFSLGFLDIPVPAGVRPNTDRACWKGHLINWIATNLELNEDQKNLLEDDPVIKDTKNNVANRYANQRGNMETHVLHPYLETKLTAGLISTKVLSGEDVTEESLGKYKKLIKACYAFVGATWTKTSKLKKGEKPTLEQSCFFLSRIIVWAIARDAVIIIDDDDECNDITEDTDRTGAPLIDAPELDILNTTSSVNASPSSVNASLSSVNASLSSVNASPSSVNSSVTDLTPSNSMDRVTPSSSMDKAMHCFGITVLPQNYKQKAAKRGQKKSGAPLQKPKTPAGKKSSIQQKKAARAKELTALRKYDKKTIIGIVNQEFAKK